MAKLSDRISIRKEETRQVFIDDCHQGRIGLIGFGKNAALEQTNSHDRKIPGADGARHHSQHATIRPAIDRRGICFRQRQIVDHGHLAYARNNLQPVENLPVEFDLSRPRVVFPGRVGLDLCADGDSHR
jgi:hypothetical protein